MTLTIFKNDDFENVGFKVEDNSGQHIYHYGIQSGWEKRVIFNTQRRAAYYRIMLSEQRVRDLESFRHLFFDVANDNDWYDHQPVRMNKLEHEIEMEQGLINSALRSLC